jgi:hypothetical protein
MLLMTRFQNWKICAGGGGMMQFNCHPQVFGVIRVIENQITTLQPYNARYTGDHRSIIRRRYAEMITRISIDLCSFSPLGGISELSLSATSGIAQPAACPGQPVQMTRVTSTRSSGS